MIYNWPRYFLQSFESIGLSIQKNFKNWFSRWQLSCIFNLNYFSYFVLETISILQMKFESFGLSVEEKSFEIDFQDDGHLGFPIGVILVTFDLQVTPILRSIFRVYWPFDSGEVQNRFSWRQPLRLSWISDQNDFSRFWCTSSKDTSYQVSGKSAFPSRRKSSKEIFKIAAVFDFRTERF